VIICAYIEDRWELMLQSVASVQEQTLQPCEIIACIDHNTGNPEEVRRAPGVGPKHGSRDSCRRDLAFLRTRREFALNQFNMVIARDNEGFGQG
jgi:hypothetical protein